MLVGTMPCGATAGGGGGSGGSSVDLRAGAAYKAELTPTNSTATWSMQSGGTCTSTGEATYTWLLSGLNSDYELFVSLISGALTSGSTGSWNVLSVNRNYTVTRTSDVAGTDTATLEARIRRASDMVVIAGPVTVTVSAEVTV